MIVLRAVMIALVGATLVSQFSWVLYLFCAFLVFAGSKMWVIADHVPDIANNPLLKFLKRPMRATAGLHGNALWVRENDPAAGRRERFETPLFLALVLVFIGSKILLVGIIGKIPAMIPLSVTFGLIAGGVLLSLWKTHGQPAEAGAA